MARHGGSLAVTRGATEKKVTWSREFTHLGLLLLPALALLVYLFLLVLPGIDPGRANYQRFAGAYNMIRFSLLSLIAIAYGVVHVWIRGYPIDVAAAGLLLVGVMLVIFGVVMDKIRPNWSVGIRTPWTLTSQES